MAWWGVPVPSRSRSECHAGRQSGGVDSDRVGAGRQVGERVVAVARGDRARDDRAAAVEELHGDAVEAGLAAVLDAVAVGVVPHPVAEAVRVPR